MLVFSRKMYEAYSTFLCPEQRNFLILSTNMFIISQYFVKLFPWLQTIFSEYITYIIKKTEGAKQEITVTWFKGVVLLLGVDFMWVYP